MSTGLQNSSAWERRLLLSREQPTAALAHHFTTMDGKHYPPYPVGVLCETPPHTHTLPGGVPVAAAEDQRPAQCGANLPGETERGEASNPARWWDRSSFR